MSPNKDLNHSEPRKKRFLRSRTKYQLTNERRDLLAGMTSKTIARILLQHPTVRISLNDFYSAFKNLTSRGVIGKRSESSIRGVLKRFRDEGIIETNPESRLPARYRLYWLTKHGYDLLQSEFESQQIESLSSRDRRVLDTLPSPLSKGPTENRQPYPRLLDLHDILDLRAARFEKVKLDCRIDLHIGRVIHAGCEGTPGPKDRSEKATHSEESFSLTITHLGWVSIIPKRPDWPRKLVEWMEFIKIPSADIVQVWTDILNQTKDINSILEIPAKMRLPDGDTGLLDLRELDPGSLEVIKRRQIEYVRSHGGEFEIRGQMGDQLDFVTLFFGASAAVWPEFSDLRENLKSELQSLKENLDKDVLQQLQKQQAEINRLQLLVDRLIGVKPEKKTESKEEKEADYFV